MSVYVGFLYIENCNPLLLRCILISMKLMDSCNYFSIVNCIGRHHFLIC
jgi:hypothetical protein